MTGISFEVLLTHTEWERADWLAWFRREGDTALATSLGPHAGGRFETVGDVIRHIFSAEKRYGERLAKRELSDQRAVGSDRLEELFAYGATARAQLRALIETLPANAWDVPHEFLIMGFQFNASPRKIITHVLLHEIRHWAQLATLLRTAGYKVQFHDFLASPALT